VCRACSGAPPGSVVCAKMEEETRRALARSLGRSVAAGVVYPRGNGVCAPGGDAWRRLMQQAGSSGRCGSDGRALSETMAGTTTCVQEEVGSAPWGPYGGGASWWWWCTKM